MTVGYMAQYKCFIIIIIIIIININSKTISPINLVMVSSERAIMYLLITAFNNSCGIVISIKYSDKIDISHVCPAHHVDLVHFLGK